MDARALDTNSTGLVIKKINHQPSSEVKISSETLFHETQQEIATLIKEPKADLELLREKLSLLKYHAKVAQLMLTKKSYIFMKFRFHYLNFQFYQKLIEVLSLDSSELAFRLIHKAEEIVKKAKKLATGYEKNLQEELGELTTWLAQLKMNLNNKMKKCSATSTIAVISPSMRISQR